MAELLVNGDFDLPVTAGVTVYPNASVPGWDSDTNQIEIWGSGQVVPDHGSPATVQKAELDQVVNDLTQVVTVPATAGFLRWRYSHRQRPGTGNNQVQLRLGDASQPVASNPIVHLSPILPNGDPNWHDYYGTVAKPAGVTSIRYRLEAVLPVGGSAGNAIDYTSLIFVEPIDCDCCPTEIIQCYDPDGVPTGVEMLANGDFTDSCCFGNNSPGGPGWITSYLNTAGDNNIFSTGGEHYAYFTTNAGQVTANNGNALPIPALGGRSIAVNVGVNFSVPILQWLNVPFVNGQSYRFEMDSAIIFNPWGVAMRIDGGNQGSWAIPAPSAVSTWQRTTVNFVFNGPTGNYPIGIFSNSATVAGNDHTFDNFSLIATPRSAVLFTCPSGSVWYDLETSEQLSPTEIATLRPCSTPCVEPEDVTTFTPNATNTTWTATGQSQFYTYGKRVTQWRGTYTGPASASFGFSAPEIGGTLNGAALVPAYTGAAPYFGSVVQNGITITVELSAPGSPFGYNANGFGFNGGNTAQLKVNFSSPVTLTVQGGVNLGDGPNETITGISVTTVPTCSEPTFACTPMSVNLHAETRAFNVPGGGASQDLGADEYMSFSVAPSATDMAAVVGPPTWYHTTAASPLDTCGGHINQFDWNNIQSMFFDYSNGPSANLTVGGAAILFSVPGGPISFQFRESGLFLPGQAVYGAIPGGGVARLRYIYGPTNTNGTRVQSPFCGYAAGSNNIGFHLASTTNTDQPSIHKIEFFEEGCIEEPLPSLLAVNYFAFDDSLTNREALGNFSVAPSFMSRAKETTTPGFYGGSPQPGALNINSATAGQVVFVWEGIPTVEMDYDDVPGSGGVAQEALFQVFYNGTIVSWPAFTELAVAASVTSNPAADGRSIRMTAVSGPNGTRPRRDPTVTNIRIGTGSGNTVPVRYRLEIV